eukprot:CAMPEP_0194316332 /NCGR_PEP_ID=MMETSP0171-20130528/13142_1 /TAXON_ID=218684 /ORGANISM="Corethron pennatum, Strain L29A3" /LENGTH=32 /DNA_ID= /DNA_START= /DNA_END= /DNA_ORIENTATION=
MAADRKVAAKGRRRGQRATAVRRAREAQDDRV